MASLTLDSKTIDTLRNVPDLIPAYREYYEDWHIRTFNRKHHECRNYLSPNRRDFFKILLITGGQGLFTMGLHTYVIDAPTILFIHPNDIISWRNTGGISAGYYSLFRKSYLAAHPQLKAAIERHDLFHDKRKSVIRLADAEATRLEELFARVQEEELSGRNFKEDAMQVHLQMIMIESLRAGNFPAANAVTEEYSKVHQFFQLLEQEMTGINHSTPVRMKTAKGFAAGLFMHPNALNALLKKHTGQNVSTHIKSRLLEESKVLLLQTNWSLQEIGYGIGFTEQPNFNAFFKKNTGITPAEFRRNYPV